MTTFFASEADKIKIDRMNLFSEFIDKGFKLYYWAYNMPGHKTEFDMLEQMTKSANKVDTTSWCYCFAKEPIDPDAFNENGHPVLYGEHLGWFVSVSPLNRFVDVREQVINVVKSLLDDEQG